MAIQALRVLLRDWNLTSPREANDAERLGRILHMRRTRSVASFAAFHLELVARIEAEHLGMDGVRPVLCLLRMTGNANLLSDVAALLRRLSSRSCALRCRQLDCLGRHVSAGGRDLQIVSDLVCEVPVRFDLGRCGALVNLS